MLWFIHVTSTKHNKRFFQKNHCWVSMILFDFIVKFSCLGVFCQKKLLQFLSENSYDALNKQPIPDADSKLTLFKDITLITSNALETYSKSLVIIFILNSKIFIRYYTAMLRLPCLYWAWKKLIISQYWIMNRLWFLGDFDWIGSVWFQIKLGAQFNSVQFIAQKISIQTILKQRSFWSQYLSVLIIIKNIFQINFFNTFEKSKSIDTTLREKFVECQDHFVKYEAKQMDSLEQSKDILLK
jgi:hypothetical protein